MTETASMIWQTNFRMAKDAFRIVEWTLNLSSVWLQRRRHRRNAAVLQWLSFIEEGAYN